MFVHVLTDGFDRELTIKNWERFTGNSVSRFNLIHRKLSSMARQHPCNFNSTDTSTIMSAMGRDSRILWIEIDIPLDEVPDWLYKRLTKVSVCVNAAGTFVMANSRELGLRQDRHKVLELV